MPRPRRHGLTIATRHRTMHAVERRDKAAGLISFVAVLREKLPPDTWAHVVARLDPPSRAMIEHPPLPMSWIPHDPFFNLLLACHDVAFAGHPEAMFDISREQLRRDMTTIYKVLMYLASTETVLKKATAIYATYSRNGVMTARILGPTRAEIILGDVWRGHPCFWEFQRGAIMGVLEVAGTKGPTVRIASGGGDATTTVFDITWK